MNQGAMFAVAGSRIYLGDSLEVLKREDIAADLLVTDPPYGVKFQSNMRTATEGFGAIANDGGSDGENQLVRRVLTAAVDALRSGRHAYVFHSGDGAPADERLAATVDLVWDKGIVGMGDLACPWGSQYESVMFAVKVPSKANRERGDGNLAARLRRGSVLRVQRKHSSGVKRHPTEKPVELLRVLIESSSAMGETVLDPFVGCGSTVIAAMLEGRKGVGIELEPKYFEVAKARMEATARWLDQAVDP
jgi:DNA modification methylase